MNCEMLHITAVFLKCNALLCIDGVECPPVNNPDVNLLWVTWFEKLIRGKPTYHSDIKCSQMFCSLEFT